MRIQDIVNRLNDAANMLDDSGKSLEDCRVKMKDIAGFLRMTIQRIQRDARVEASVELARMKAEMSEDLAELNAAIRKTKDPAASN